MPQDKSNDEISRLTEADIMRRLDTLTKWQQNQQKANSANGKHQTLLGSMMRRASIEERNHHKDGLDAEQDTADGAKDTLDKKKTMPFLKRGEGIKRRYGVDPAALRIDNLPAYKFRSRIGSLSNCSGKRSSEKPVSAPKPLIEDKQSPPKVPASWDAFETHEVRFQQMLMAKNANHSTPDLKSANLTKPTATNSQVPGPHSTDTSAKPGITWAEVLNSHKIKPISLNRSPETSPLEREEDEHLSVFELLERKANEGSIDMDSSCIKEFMKRKQCRQLDESDADEFPVKDSLKEFGLKPLVKSVMQDDGDLGLDELNNLSHSNVTGLSSPSPAGRSKVNREVHVRFAEKNDTHEFEEKDTEYDEDTLSDGLTSANDESTAQDTSSLMQQVKDVLFNVWQCRADNKAFDIHTFSQNLSSQQSTFSEDLQEKANLMRKRLDELEKEITTFKRNNLELTKSKQLHELEKSTLKQEHEEALEQIKDEKIQMEIYLHDERIKIQDERKKFNQEMRIRKSVQSSKDRKEIVRLKGEVESLQDQLKNKEQSHVTAQSRLRAQIRSLEKEFRALHDQIERLKQENQKLQVENLRISRDTNKTMLQEINRNIAKLAPKAAQNPVLKVASNGAKTIAKKTLVKKATKQTEFPKQTKASMPDLNRRNKKPSTPPNEYSSSSREDNSFYKSDDTEEDNESVALDVANVDGGDFKLSNGSTDKLTEPTESGKEIAGGDAKIGLKREIVNADGSKDIMYANGNIKKISADGLNIRMLYFNKDIKETNINEGIVKYYFAEKNLWQTSYLDGLEILEYPDGHTEHRFKNGIVECYYPNSSMKITNPSEENVLEEWRYADGSTLVKMRNGDTIMSLPDGQKEIHTKYNKRREMPDGTVKLVYPDGSQETRYSNGRVRLRDKDGHLVMDTAGRY